MNDIEKRNIPFNCSDEPDGEIEFFESMTEEQVDAELHRYGIDPNPTIHAVTTLVRSKLQEWRARSRPYAANALIQISKPCKSHAPSFPASRRRRSPKRKK